MIHWLDWSCPPYRWIIRSKAFHSNLERLAELTRISAHADPASLQAASDEFSRILQNLRVRGVWKHTGRQRLRQMDQLLAEYAGTQGWKQLEMIDIGASDGITTLDTVSHLATHAGISARITMIDRDIGVNFFRNGGSSIYFTSTRRPLLLTFGKIALCLEPTEGFDGVLFNRLARAISRHCEKVLDRSDPNLFGTISMINPSVQHCPAIEVLERDLFTPEPAWKNGFDAVRVSNVLNIAYYPEAKIREALGLLHGYLREGGALLASRNVIEPHGETELGGLWRKRGPGFVREAGLNQWPEIAGLIDAFQSGPAEATR